MKKKVWRAKHKQDSEVVLNKLTDELITEIVKEAKPKKRASKKKEA